MKTKKSAPNELPLFFRQPTTLSFDRHAASGLKFHANFGFAAEAVAVPLCTSEFDLALRHYPIVFAPDGAPLAIVGLRRDENLFVGRDGQWRAECYVPAYVRRYPFIVTEPSDGTLLLGIDEGSDRFVLDRRDDPDAQAFFDQEGQPSAVAKEAMSFCNAFQVDHLKTSHFAEALRAGEVLVPNRADMQLADGSRSSLDGFMVVDEAAFRALPETTVALWHAQGWLNLIAFHYLARLRWEDLLQAHANRHESLAA